MSWFLEFLTQTWTIFFLAAPFILLGLLLASLIQALLSSKRVVHWLGRPGLSSVFRAAILGIPISVCSCGIIPVALALRRKGTSRPASLSLLISTPETSLESISLTWGLLGPVMAIFRPIAAVFAAILAGIVAIATGDDKDPKDAAPEPDSPTDKSSGCGSNRVCENGGGDLNDADYIGIRTLRASFGHWVRRALSSRFSGPTNDSEHEPTAVPPFPTLARTIGSRAITGLLDDLAFWLTIGFIVAGAVSASIPENLIGESLRSGILPMLLMLAIAAPIYSCALESTPIAAALVAKGFSPGAALVFLLAGPAINAASILLVAKNFGSRFLRAYLIGVLGGALLAGLALDALIGLLGWSIVPRLSIATSWPIATLQFISGIILGSLILWRLWLGAARRGIRDLREAYSDTRKLPWVRSFERAFQQAKKRGIRPAIPAIVMIAALVYLGTGFVTIPPDSLGYGRLFGKITQPDLSPGLHWVPPAPFGRCEIWRVGYPRKCDVGFQTDLRLLINRRENRLRTAGDSWHSTVTAMNTDPRIVSYLTGDENLVELSFTVHYFLSDPYQFFYGIDKSQNPVGLYAESAARELVASIRLDSLLTAERSPLEIEIRDLLQTRLDHAEIGVRVASVHIVDLHPPQEAVFAFRDVSSAREDHQTRIHQAHEFAEREIPVAHGHADLQVARALAETDSMVARAAGRSLGLLARTRAYRRHPEVLRDQLWIETSERVLGGRQKFIVPPGTRGSNITLWKLPPAIPVAEEKK